MDTAQYEFNALAVSFSHWAQKQSANIDADIARVTQELKDLSDRLIHLRNLMIGFGVGVGVGIATAVIGFWAGPFAPVLWVGYAVEFALCPRRREFR